MLSIPFPSIARNFRQKLHRLTARARLAIRRLHLGRARKPIVAILGTIVMLAGIAMIILPGPAILFIPLGLAILATEFLWVRRWLKRLRLNPRTTSPAAHKTHQTNRLP